MEDQSLPNLKNEIEKKEYVKNFEPLKNLIEKEPKLCALIFNIGRQYEQDKFIKQLDEYFNYYG